MNDITRIDSGPRMSQAVCFGGLVHTAGQVAIQAADEDVQGQTRAVLEAIDGLLKAAGTDKTKLLTAQIWLTSMEDFAAMNEVWDAWVAPGAAPTRACVESKLALPSLKVEIAVTAALNS